MDDLRQNGVTETLWALGGQELSVVYCCAWCGVQQKCHHSSFMTMDKISLRAKHISVRSSLFSLFDHSFVSLLDFLIDGVAHDVHKQSRRPIVAPSCPAGLRGGCRQMVLHNRICRTGSSRIK